MGSSVTISRLQRGCRKYREIERRNPMYRVATFVIANFWGDATRTTDGLGVLLLTWNQAFYRYGAPDFDLLEKCLRRWERSLNRYRTEKLGNQSFKLVSSEIRPIFDDFLSALRGKDEKRSPVAVAKALHLLGPGFFPLWDVEIAKGYGCKWKSSEDSGTDYLKFMMVMKRLMQEMISEYAQAHAVSQDSAEEAIVRECSPENEPRTLLKLIDEYNYVIYTKKLTI